MRDSTPSRRSFKHEGGVVLVLTAMLLFAIFMIAALALDFSQMAVGVERGTNTARFAALAALQAYSQAPGNKTVEERIALATTQANSISGMNLNMTMGGKHVADQLMQDNAGGPSLIPGKYYAEAPSTLCGNPCNSGESPPCFVELPDVKTSCEPVGFMGPTQPNSFRVFGNFYSDMRTIFARVAGMGYYAVPVDVIAAFTPRRGVFLVDISATNARETHWYSKTSPDYPSWYSYYLAADNGTGMTYYDDALRSGSWPNLNDDRSSPPAGAPAPASAPYKTLHYKSDYSIVSTSAGAAPAPFTGSAAGRIRMLSDSNYGDAGEYYSSHHPDPANPPPTVTYSSSQYEGTYRVDTFRDANFTGPEPFNTIFRGLDSAVEAFKERAVTGDRLGIIFFDHTLVWPRIIKLTSDFDYLKKFTDLTVSSDPLADSGIARVLRHGIFPGKRSMTNGLMAVTEALRQFDELQASSVSSVDFMVYFGDGLVNCVVNTAPIGGGAVEACSDDYPHYRQAISELHQFAVSTLYPRRISFNAILVGQHVGPHILGLKDDGTGCMSDTEARNAEKEFVRGTDLPDVPTNRSDPSYNPKMLAWVNAYRDMSDSAPFYEANEDMYRIARATGGIWGPVRTYTTVQSECNPATCASTDPATAPRLTKSCATAGTDVDSYIRDEIMAANPYMIVPGPTSSN